MRNTKPKKKKQPSLPPVSHVYASLDPKNQQYVQDHYDAHVVIDYPVSLTKSQMKGDPRITDLGEPHTPNSLGFAVIENDWFVTFFHTGGAFVTKFTFPNAELVPKQGAELKFNVSKPRKGEFAVVLTLPHLLEKETV